MTADREHMQTLEWMLAKLENERRTHERHIREYGGLGVANSNTDGLRTSMRRAQAEADAIEWALEKLTRSER
jgi:hypothetical protein